MAWSGERWGAHALHLCSRLANSEKQGVRTHAVSMSGKRPRGRQGVPTAVGGSPVCLTSALFHEHYFFLG